MKTLRLIILTTLIAASAVFAASSDVYNSARVAAMGGAYAAVVDDPVNVDFNPALIGLFNKSVSAAFSFENPYGLDKVISLYGAAAVGTKYVSSGFSFEMYKADEIYSELMFQGNIAGKFFDRLALGFGGKYFQVDIGDSFQEKFFNIDFGAAVEIVHGDMVFGVSAMNILIPTGAITNEYMPMSIHAGVSTTLLKNFLFSFELAYDIEHGLSAHVGQEYSVADIFFLRAGFSSDPGIASFGVGVKYVGIQLDYAFVYSPEVGMSHVSTVRYTYRFGKEKTPDMDTPTDTINKYTPIQKQDLNSANHDALMTIFKSESEVERVIKYRETNLFYTVAELAKVEGISESRMFEVERYLFVKEKDFDKEIYWLNHIEALEMKEAGMSEQDIKELLFARYTAGHFKSIDNALAALSIEGKTIFTKIYNENFK